MSLANLAEWNEKSGCCGAKASSCGGSKTPSACGGEKKPSACGGEKKPSACGGSK